MASVNQDASPLVVNVLGEVSAARDGVPLDLGGRRQRAVLGMLVLARGDTVPADRLVDALWADRPPPAAVAALQSYVSHLRRRLEPDRDARSRASVIASQGGGYSLLLRGDAVDAWHFERLVRDAAGHPSAEHLQRALDLWRGPAYAEYADEPWAQAETARLTELREVAREQLAAARLARGEAAVTVAELESLVAAAPLREERWRLLILALYRSHRQADALAALRRARQLLADELGIDPGPALRALEAEVHAQAESLGLPPTQPAAAPRPAAAPYTAAGTATVAQAPSRAALLPAAPAVTGGTAGGDLVDRDRELADLELALTDALRGDARLLLVEGPAGIGKTRLLTEARRRASAAGAQVFTARGSRLEKEYGFGAIRQLFDAAAAAPGMLDGPAAPAATVFDVAGTAQREDSGLAVMHGLYRLTVNLAAAGPLLLAVDDLQWCDSGSLRFLAYLVRRVEGLPVLIVATLRTGEPHDDEAILDELTADPITVRVRPGPLSAQGAASVVRSRLGAAADSFVDACHRSTTGNPLLLRQLLQALHSERVPPDAAHAGTVTAIGSRAVSGLVLMRLGRLSPACVAVAKAIAVLGNGAALPTVAVLAGVPEDDAAVAVATLARAEVLRDEYPLGFVHPLVADAVYSDLAPGQRQLRHDRAARVLAAAGAAPEQVAAHLLQVPPRGDAWVVGVLRTAAARARDRAAPDAAVASLTRALQEPPDASALPGVLLELGQAEAISNAPAAMAHLRQAYDAIEDPRVRAELALTLGRTLVFVGPPGSATRFAREAGAALAATHPAGGSAADDRQALLATERISGYLHDLDPAGWRRRPEPEITGTGRGARMLAVALAWEAVMDGVDRARAVELARFGVADGDLLSADTGLLWVIAGQVLDLCDEDSTGLWSAGLAQAHQRGDLFTALGMHLWRGYVQWGRGDLREASQALAAGNELSHAWGAGGIASGYGEAFQLGVLLDRGDLPACRAYLEQVQAHPRITEGARMFGEAQARLLVAEGCHTEALEILDGVAALMSGVANPAWRPWRSARARALAGQGRTNAALELVEAELELAEAWGAPRVIGRTLRLRGELRGGDGAADLRAAAGLLSGASAGAGAGVGGGVAARVEHARALVSLARVCGGAEAVAALRQAAALAVAGGADGVHRDAVAALRALGQPAPAAPPPIETLSATERQILDRHRAGVGERDIAEALLLTPRSVRAALDAMRAAGI